MITHSCTTDLLPLHMDLNNARWAYNSDKQYYYAASARKSHRDIGKALTYCKQSKRALRKQCHKVAAALYLRGAISHKLFIQLVSH